MMNTAGICAILFSISASNLNAQTDTLKESWTGVRISLPSRSTTSSDSIVSLSSDDTLFQHFAGAVDYIRRSPDVKRNLSHWIRDTNDVQVSVSRTLVMINAQWFARQIIWECLGREYMTGQHPDDSLYEAIVKGEFQRWKTFVPFIVPQLDSLSSPSRPDLLLCFDPYQRNVILATIDPFEGQPGFSEGMEFIFYFDGMALRKAYGSYWRN